MPNNAFRSILIKARYPTPGDKINSNAFTTRKLHAENAKCVSGEFYCYVPREVTDAKRKFRFLGNTKIHFDS